MTTRGARFGHYEIVSALGAGGMGEVYRARDPRLAREVAVKVIAFDAAARPERARRFEQEARAVAALNHPNVLSVFDAGTEGGTPYVVFELLEGETLRARLLRDRVPLRKALDWSAQIARGLGAAHEQGIVHRDLKPENVFLTRDERVKILDFGLAKLVAADEREGSGEHTISGQTDPGTVMGTVGYMSPEQVRGLGADARSDIFALGAVLYELLSGRQPFRRDTAAETLTAILKEEPAELTARDGPVPPALERIVRRCLEKDPAHRFRAAQDLAFALEALSGSAPELGGASVAAPTRRARVALATLALAASGGTLFYAGRKTAEPSVPSFQRLTFRRGAVMSARYAPDGRTVVYAASWDGDPELRVFSTRVESPESTRLDLPPAGLFGVSRTGELALALRQPFEPAGRARRFSRLWTGTLARIPLAGGTPRSVLDDVSAADWVDTEGSFAVARSHPWRSRLEFPIGTVVFEDQAIWNPRVSPGRDTVAFFHGRAGQAVGSDASVAVIDRTGSRTELSTGWKWATGLAWATGGNEVWFTATKSGTSTQELYAVTLTGGQRLLMRMPAWTVVQDVGPDGRVLLTSGTLRVQTTCLAPGWSREREVSWLESSMIEDLSADGRLLLVSDHGASGGPRGALYLLGTTEPTTPPIRLGEALFGAALSPDGRWVTVKATEQIVLLPTGAGESRRFETTGVNLIGIRWFRDGKRCLVLGSDKDRRLRTYVLDIQRGVLEALALEGVICGWPSPDGRELLCIDAETREWTVYSLERGGHRPVAGLLPDEKVVHWATDGAVYVRSEGSSPEIHRLDLRTGRRTLWRRIANPDPACLLSDGFGDVFIAPQTGAYCYTTWCNLLDLYQVTGLE